MKKSNKKEDIKSIEKESNVSYQPIKKPEKKKGKKKHKKLKLFLKIMLITIILLIVIVGRNSCSTNI